jgi:hypothetical protein
MTVKLVGKDVREEDSRKRYMGVEAIQMVQNIRGMFNCLVVVLIEVNKY